MEPSKIGDIVRTIVGFLAGLAVAKGYGDAELWTAIGGAAAVVAAAAWTFFRKKPAAPVAK